MLVIFRRLRNPWMLALLALIFACLSGAFASMGVPYLFWHDNIFARMFGLLGVGIFMEEWVYVAMLLDSDDKNPSKRVEVSSSVDRSLPATQYVKETLQIVSEDVEQASTPETSGEVVFDHTRHLHTYASFSLCVIVSVASYFIFSWNDLSTTFYYRKHIYMLLSGVYFSLTGAFLVFLVRKWFNLQFQDPASLASRLFSKLTFVLEDKEELNPEFKRLHQIAFGKNACFGLILCAFCIAYWFFAASPSVTVPVSIGIGFAAMLIYLWMLLRTEKGSKGRTVSILFTVIHLIVFPTIYFLNSGEVATSVALIASVLLTLLVGALGWIVFQSRRHLFEYLVLGLLIAFGAIYLGYHRVPQVVGMYSAGEPSIVTTENALQKVIDSAQQKSDEEHRGWISQFNSSSNSKTKPVLVVVANSGGGIKAQVWSSAVIHALEKTVNEHLESIGSEKRFNHHLRLMTGTSGGMVGASHWVGSLGQPRSGCHTPEDMVYDMTKDALDDVSRQLFYNDLIAFPFNLAAGKHRLDARGKALERAFELHSPVFAKRMIDLKEGEDAGWRPILAFAPTVVEDGRRFLISNQPIEYTLVSEIPSVVGNTGQDESDPVTMSVAGYSWRVNFPYCDTKGPNTLKLSQAARLNANFPVFVDSPKLPFDPPVRLMDAGYVDNYGVVIASQWLHHNLEWLKENTSKVLIVQIVASPLERNISLADEMSGTPETSGFASASFNKTVHHTDMAFSRFAKQYNAGGGDFKMVTFEYAGDAALTWYLSNREKFSLLYPFLSNELIGELEQKSGDELSKGELEDEFDLVPLTITKDKPLYQNVVNTEGPRFLARISSAGKSKPNASKKQKKIDQSFQNQKESRKLIRKKLESVKAWWTDSD